MELPVDYRHLTPSQRRVVREAYIEKQGGKCKHCEAPLNDKAAETILRKPVDKDLFPANFFRWPVHLHHDHNTGLTIGAVHCYCNAVLWQYHGE